MTDTGGSLSRLLKVYEAEGDWVNAAVSMASALPMIGSVVAGVTKATKIAKAGNIIGKAFRTVGKT